MLDPEFAAHDHETNEEAIEGFMNVVERIAILNEVRKQHAAGETYADAWKKRVDAIGNDPSKLADWDSFPKYPTFSNSASVKEFCSAANAQVTMYRSRKGVFARTWVFDSAESQPAYLWWDANGASCPELQCVARMVLAHPASSSICENALIASLLLCFVKDARRNRLEHTRADKLVALFHNLRDCVSWRA